MLVVDTDPQGNATTSLIGLEDMENTLLEVIIGDSKIEDAIVPLERSEDGRTSGLGEIWPYSRICR